MKQLSIVLFFTVINISLMAQAIKGVDAQDILCQKTINEYIKGNLKDYKRDFVFTGKSTALDGLYTCVLQGVKKDTIYNLLFVMKECKITEFQSIPVATYYVRNESMIKEYVVGHIYTGYNNDKTCIRVDIENYNPIKVDTLKNMFSYHFYDAVSHDSLFFCK
jgi:hypothetical protein